MARFAQLTLLWRALSVYRTAVTLLVTAGALAAKPALPQEALPVLISTKSNQPAWKSLSELQHFAAQGNPAACFELGVRCLEADGLTQDTPQAIRLLTQAAQGGVTNATFRLGKITTTGSVCRLITPARLNITRERHKPVLWKPSIISEQCWPAPAA